MLKQHVTTTATYIHMNIYGNFLTTRHSIREPIQMFLNEFVSAGVQGNVAKLEVW
jgi:hypothetical protein